MATVLITTFLNAKMRDAKTSVALYSVSSDVDGVKMARQMGVRSNKAIVEMLKTSREALTKDPQAVAAVLQGAMGGVSRRLLESVTPEREFELLREELIAMACAYLESCTQRQSA